MIPDMDGWKVRTPQILEYTGQDGDYYLGLVTGLEKIFGKGAVVDPSQTEMSLLSRVPTGKQF